METRDGGIGQSEDAYVANIDIMMLNIGELRMHERERALRTETLPEALVKPPNATRRESTRAAGACIDSLTEGRGTRQVSWCYGCNCVHR